MPERLNHWAEESGLWVDTTGDLIRRHEVGVTVSAEAGQSALVSVHVRRPRVIADFSVPANAARDLAASLVEASDRAERFQPSARLHLREVQS